MCEDRPIKIVVHKDLPKGSLQFLLNKKSGEQEVHVHPDDEEETTRLLNQEEPNKE